MEREELFRRLEGYEWRDVEFKEAAWAAPSAAYETVSAFANTAGGWLIFGVKQSGRRFEVSGVDDVDKVQSEFLTTLRSRGKLNRVIGVEENLIDVDGKAILVFRVPEVSRSDKPVFLDGDIRRSYLRSGGSDVKCSQSELERLIRDASEERYDGRQLAAADAEHCFDTLAIRWYRGVYALRNPSADASLSDLEFLCDRGLVVDSGERLLPTYAAILLFGASPSLNRLLPRPVVDLQFVDAPLAGGTADRRWDDRLVVETNLIQAWRVIVDWYMKHNDHPFRLDPNTLQRDETPPDYIAFREAIVNLLTHQDYADHSRTPEVRLCADATMFWNPGDGFTSSADLFALGEREVRNPRIVGTFRRIGLSEQAGTGLRAMASSWQKLGHVPPTIVNDRERQAFRVTLLKEALLSDEQRRFQTSLGVHLSEPEARTFAFACREGKLRLPDVRLVNGISQKDASAIADRLLLQHLLVLAPESDTEYVVAERVRQLLDRRPSGRGPAGESETDLSTAQVPSVPDDLSTAQVDTGSPDLSTAQVALSASFSDPQWKIVELCDVSRSLSEIMLAAGLTHRGFFTRQHLTPLVDAGIVELTNPSNPRASNQRYVLSAAGLELRRRRFAATGGGEERR